jgi:hypothetical protein
MSAAEKRLVLSAWTKFLKHGCQKDHFTERLYHHLMQHCSFIAHHDRHNFYGYYFDTASQSTYRSSINSTLLSPVSARNMEILSG